MTRTGAIIVTIAVMMAIAGPLVSPFDPATQELSLRLNGPSSTHWFGLDELGRDVLARVLSGARISLLVGLVVVGGSSIVGTFMGAVAGYFGGAVDEIISRAIDILLAFPGLLLAIAIVAVLGPSLVNVVLALTIIGWVGYARLVRGQALRVRELEYVLAARASGARTSRILLHHVIPAVLPAVAVQATLGMGGAILSEAALSFLGLGVQPPTPSWGSMIADGRDLYQLRTAPWTSLAPGIAIGAAVLGFNLLGDALRDAYDPRAIRASIPKSAGADIARPA